MCLATTSFQLFLQSTRCHFVASGFVEALVCSRFSLQKSIIFDVLAAITVSCSSLTTKLHGNSRRLNLTAPPSWYATLERKPSLTNVILNAGIMCIIMCYRHKYEAGNTLHMAHYSAYCNNFTTYWIKELTTFSEGTESSCDGFVLVDSTGCWYSLEN